MPTASENKTTCFEYNLDGNLVKLIAENPTTGDQVTEWIYGVTIAQGSALESKALVYQKKYPDSTGAADRVTYTYNRQGQVTTMKDQVGTTHGYAFDKFGRILEDAASFVPSSPLDKTVQKIARTYEIRGAVEKVTSWGLDGTAPVLRNEVLLTYNAYGQLARDYQEHSGAANTATSLFVSYNYADGSANTVRRTGITYPQIGTPPTSATTITTAYVGTAADALSRPDALKEGSATLCSYRYLGAGVFIGVKYDAASDVELTYQDGGTGDAGDKYTGLDRFGRLIETLWKRGAAAQVHSQYGRNRFGGVVWRKDLTAHALGVTTEDNFYQYDGLYQVKEHQRGNLIGTPPTGITNLQQEEDWTYDATGNWDTYANSNPTSSQTRTNNKANEITQIIKPGGNVNPTYDPVGNMLTKPQFNAFGPLQAELKWDAWNRLVEFKESQVFRAYRYDGLMRRLLKSDNSTTASRHFFYDDQWRTIEERHPISSIAIDQQYTWGLRDRWDLLRRKRSTGGSSLNEIHFCVRDYLDPVAIVGVDGLAKERYAYSAFGIERVLAPDYSGGRSTLIFKWEFLFHGEFKDDTTFYNYGYRYYDAWLGRWLSRDPLGESEGTNIYAMIRNNPVDALDSYGLKCCLITIRWNWASASFSGHSILKCDDGTYISWNPTNYVGDGEPHSYLYDFVGGTKRPPHYGKPNSDLMQDGDFTTSTGRRGTVVCLDCLKGEDVKQPAAGDNWHPFSNCADANRAGATCALKDEKPKCPCGEQVKDLLKKSLPITTPYSTEQAFRDVKANDCKRYKCVKTPRKNTNQKGGR